MIIKLSITVLRVEIDISTGSDFKINYEMFAGILLHIFPAVFLTEFERMFPKKIPNETE